MATALTINTRKYSKLFDTYGENAVSVPCPGLVEFVERLQLSGAQVEDHLNHIFAPYRGCKIDTVVLGCTHYVFLRKVIAAALPGDTAVVDGNAGTVKELHRRLIVADLLNDTAIPGSVAIHSSGGKPSIALMENLLAGNIE